jgi:UDP-GlcNAc:undecaprenyl-phosphate/decaprenyl-phosphate GlcNAc-1-phosphate transferase
VYWLASLVALAAALVLTPPILRHLREDGYARENYRGTAVAFPAGIAIVAVLLVVAGPLLVLERIFEDVVPLDMETVLFYSLGVAVLGLIDDLLSGPPARTRGWRGHGAAVLGGGFSTGALKAVGTLSLALYVTFDPDTLQWLLAAVLLALTTNLFNLLDLRPGRAVKAFVLLGAGLTIGTLTVGAAGYAAFVMSRTEVLELFGFFAAPVLVVGFYDLRERAMLGDTGANLIGGLAGLWMVFTFSTLALAIALAIVLALTIYGEFRSLSVLISWMPLLRDIDSAGRNDADA